MEYKIIVKYLILLAILLPIVFGAEISSKKSATEKNVQIGSIIITTPKPNNIIVNDSHSLQQSKNGTISSRMFDASKETANKAMDLINLIGGNGTIDGELKIIGPKNGTNKLEWDEDLKGSKVGTAPLAKAMPAAGEQNEIEEEKGHQESGEAIESAEESEKTREKGEENDVNGFEMPKTGKKIIPSQAPINQIQQPAAVQPKDTEMNEFLSSSEESHVFRYFVLLFLFMAIFYLVAHNRKKIMGCILEGNSARRSGSTARYRRLSQGQGGLDDKEQPQIGIDSSGNGEKA